MRYLPALVAAALAAGALSHAPSAYSDTSEALKIAYDLHTLDNGMTVILHEDHTQPLVTVNINVNVGSRDEKAKRTGFAHLFEHLMFMGTKRVPEKKFDAWMEADGGWNNAWTSEDRTDYYDVGPSHLLPLLLWMEADRVSVLGKQINLNKLNKQRDVVRNERRQQVENEPYGIVELELPGLMFPDGHPYHHPVIGSHEDLEQASVADVKGFFAEYYVPQNMSLVIAGDFDAAKTMPLVESYFGAIAKATTPPQRKTEASEPKLTGVVRKTLEDNVTLPKVVMAWISPPMYGPGDAELDIISDVLTEGKSSKLYNALVYELQIAQSVSATQASSDLRSVFTIEVIANDGVPLDKIEAEVDAKIAEIRKTKITDRELNRVKNQYEAGFVRRMQSLSTRASMLNGYFAHHGNPGYAAQDLQRYLDVTTDDVLKVAQQVLDPDRRVIIHVLPRPNQEGGEEEKP